MNILIIIGVFLALAGVLAIAGVLLTAYMAGRRRQELLGSDDPAIPVNLAAVNDAVVAARLGGQVTFVNDHAREWFGLGSSEPDLSLLAQRVERADAFLELFAAEGKASLSIAGREVEATSHRVADGDDVTFVVVLREKPPLPTLDRADRGSGRAMQIISEVARSINASLEYEPTIQAVLEGTARLLDFDAAQVYLWDTEREALRAVGRIDAAGYESIPPEEAPTYRRDQGFPGWVARKRQPLLIRDIRRSDHLARTGPLSDPRVGSYLAVPLTVNNRFLGALEVTAHVAEAFDEEDQALLVMVAEQAALAIDNARAYAEQAGRVAELAGLQHIAASIRVLQDPERLFAQLGQRIAELMGTEIAGVLLYDREQQRLVAKRPFHGMLDPIAARYVIPLDRGSPARSMWEDVSYWFSNDVLSDSIVQELALGEIVEMSGTRTVAMAVMTVGEERSGVLQVANKIDGTPFTMEDIRLLQTYAGQAAIVVESARLYEQEQSRVAELQGLQQIVQAMSAFTQPEELYAQLTRRIAELLGVGVCGILLHDPDSERLVARVPFYGMSDELAAGYSIQVRRGLAREVWRERDLYLSNSVFADETIDLMGLRDLARSAGLRTVLLAPLSAGGRRFGMLQVSNKLDGTEFDEGDERLVRIFAGQAAALVDNARLYQDTDATMRQRAAELRAVSRVSHTLNATLELEQVLEAIAAEAKLADGARWCRLAMFEPEMSFGAEFGASGRLLEQACAQSGETLVIPDFDRQSQFAPPVAGARSALLVPIRFEDRVVGVISLYGDRPRALGDSAAEFVQALASQATSAVTNATRHEEQVRRAEQLAKSLKDLELSYAELDKMSQEMIRKDVELSQANELLNTRAARLLALHRVMESVDSTRHPDEVLRSIADSVVAEMDVDQCLIMLADDSVEGGLRLAAAAGDLPAGFDSATLLAEREPLDAVLEQQQPVIYTPGGKAGSGPARLASALGASTFIALPLPLDSSGVMLLASTMPGAAFDEEDGDLFALLASQAAVEVENARLYKTIQDEAAAAAADRDRLQQLHLITTALQQARSLRDRLLIIARGMRSIGWGKVAVMLLDKQGNTAEMVTAGYTEDEEAALPASLLPGTIWAHRFDDPEFAALAMGSGYYLRHDHPWVRKHLPGSSTVEVEPGRWHPDDQFYLPMYAGTEIIGVINLRDPADGVRPTLDSLRPIELFVQQATSALENTRLYHETLALQSYNEAVVQSIQQGIIVTDSSGVVETVNTFARNRYGWGDDLVGRALAEPDLPLAPLQLAPDVAEVLETGRPVERTGVQIAAGGEVYHLNVMVYPRFDDERTVTGAVILLEDISQRARLEADIALRARQLAALNDISRSVTAALSVEEVIQTALAEAGSVVSFDRAELWRRVGDEATRFVLAGAHGEGDARTGATVDITRVPQFEQIAQEHAPLITDIGPSARSWMGVPMLAGGEMLGILVFQKREAHAYAPADGQVAAALANQVAVALENARLFEEAQDRAAALQSRSQRLALLNRVSSTLAGSLDQNSILQTAIDEMVQATGADQGGVILFDEVQAIGRLELQSPSNPDGSVDNMQVTLENNPVILHLLQTRAPLVIDDVQHDERVRAMRDALEQRGVKSTVLIPLILANTLIGILTVDSTRERRRFEPEHVELLQTITNQVAISVQNAQLFEETVARQRELSILSDASRDMASSLDLYTVADIAADYFLRSLDIAGCAISTLDTNGDLITLVEKTRDADAPLPGLRRNLINLPAMRRVVSERKGMTIRAATAELGSSQVTWMRRRGITSMLVLPLLSRGDVVGLVELWYRDPNRRFEDRDTRTARALAASVATALENARLHDQTEARLVELSALNEISRALTQIISIDDLYHLLPPQLDRVLGIRSLTIALRDPATGQIAFPLDVVDGEPRTGASAGYSRDLYNHVIDSGQPLLTRRSAAVEIAELGFEHNEPGLKSLLAVPFTSGMIAGVLAVKDFEREGAFGESSLRVLNPLATQVAVAIENARLYKELEDRLSETTTLQEVSRVVNSALDLQQIFERVVRELAQAFHYPLIGLYTLEGSHLSLQASHGYGQAAAHVARPLVGKGIVGRAAATGEPIFLRDVANSTDELPSHPWVRSEIAVPIIADDRVLGVLTVAAGDDDPLDDNDLALMRTFAAQVATAMSNANLYEQMVKLSAELEQRVEERTRELREERDRIDTLYRIAVELTASLDLDMVLSRAMDLVGEAVGADTGVLFLVDPHSDLLIHRASMQTSGPLPPGGRRIELRTDEGLAGWVLQHRESVLVDDVQTDPRWAKIPGTETRRSLIGAPLIANDVVLGCIFFNSDTPGAFNEGHLRLVEAAANQVAGSINNAELYRMIREQAERLGVMLRSQQTEAAKSQAILESVADGVMVTDQTGEIILFNAAAERTLGLTREQALGRPASELSGLYGAGAETWAQTIERWRADPLSYTGEFLSEQIEVEDRIISVHVSPVLHGREYLGLVSVFRDITREVMADRIKSEFVARVSHELRTPMTSIKGYADLLLMGAAGEVTAEQRRFLETIKNNADRLSLLVNDLLDISRIEQGRIELDIQPIDLRELMRDVLDTFEGRMNQEGRNLTLQAEFDDDLPTIEADYGRITQVVTNLVGNAYQYTPDEGRVTVRVSREDGGVQIDVEDTGIGIPAADLDRIFERFYRGESHPIVFGTAGTGLGLSIVQQIVEMHNGRVWVESEEGVGSTFHVWLPTVFEGVVPQIPYIR